MSIKYKLYFYVLTHPNLQVHTNWL